ncbi:MAG: reverse transcriptase-like protein [Spirochaetes bacterium]|nr:reverse transcriptase-like protein [Spirochaetota bacterium]MBN2771710.1 reverse transcriptase-like protein [Spirochaetota bacterium]HRX15693.1 reverse transcriptase-like protein [Spirochaetota bacterium]
MMLSIDKVLSLLEDGKTVQKIAELADSSIEDVISLIREARKIITQKDPQKSRKKVKFKKKIEQNSDLGVIDNEELDIFKGADLSVVPLENILTFYCAVSESNGAVSVAIIIQDNEGRRVGKVQYRENTKSKRLALLKSLLRCEQIASYFKSVKTRLRFDDEYLYRQITGKNTEIEKKLINYVGDMRVLLESRKNEILIELIESHQNEKAHFLTENQ